MHNQQSSFSLPSTKASLWDRIIAAYYAFRQDYTPDTKAVMDIIISIQQKEEAKREALENKREHSLGKLLPFDKAAVDSIAGETENWHLLFDTTMKAVDTLPIDDQVVVIRYMFSGNRGIVRQLAFRNWMARHASALLDALPEE